MAMSDELKHEPELGYVFGKAKLPRGLSFPLKRSILDDFLRTESITAVTTLYYCGASSVGRVIGADYYHPRGRHSAHWLCLWIFAVPSTIRSPVESLIVNVAFPPLAGWLRSFDDRSLLRARTDHMIRFVLERPATDGPLGTPDGCSELRLIRQEGPLPNSIK